MVIQPMSIGDQIIAVINDLCQKFGVAIDWTSENVVPYIEDLCARYIQFEIQTSIAWIVCMVSVTVLAGIIWAISAIVNAHSCSGAAECVRWCSETVFWIAFVVTIIVSMYQAYDLIECCNLPEKVIIEYIESLITSSSGR